jgi:hypothetical protein
MKEGWITEDEFLEWMMQEFNMTREQAETAYNDPTFPRPTTIQCEGHPNTLNN